MKFKSLFLLFALVFPLLSNAQIVLRPEGQSANSNNELMQNFQMAAKYNASLVGYANVCGMNKADIDKIENIFINQINRARLSQENLNQLNSVYLGVKQQVMSSPRQNINCNSFAVEFKKIMDFINS